MDDSNSLLIVSIIGLMGLSAFFSATETAFSSLNRIRLKNMAEEGSKRAQLTLDLAQKYDTVLSTILVGNNIVNIAMSSLATVFFIALLGDIGVTVSTIVITILVLIFSEVTPKTLAKQSPEAFAMAVAPIIRLLLILFKPINLFFSGWNILLQNVFQTKDSQSITEEELMTLVDEAHQEGAITQEDKDLIDSVIEFNDNRVADILTSRVDLQAVSIEASKDDITKAFLDSGYSRLPVYKESIDHIIGTIHLRDFFQMVVQGKNHIDEIISDVVHVTTTTPINDLLNTLQQKKIHIAVVTNEYGGTDGIVTMEDILEELVGEIWDEHDEIVHEFHELKPSEYLVMGYADADRVLEEFGIEDEYQSTTMNGWILEKINQIPSEGDEFEIFNLHIRITKMDRHRIQKCIITVV
ncbi:HlyC/CorC family transporter [Streptococcus moroccensis]|uniref:CBS domain containing-hemolysin-like protein n=1 Tax=Streptococcus moroccensis TaxID=1451356 RepID=A0ABT9YU16_9STRE|nr:hemolysin family protein [Streptococcus moroccensis]MDQ0223412.1 CBS domain containing-hemolysin-like protein [Streptococcus moroccensis]